MPTTKLLSLIHVIVSYKIGRSPLCGSLRKIHVEVIYTDIKAAAKSTIGSDLCTHVFIFTLLITNQTQKLEKTCLHASQSPVIIFYTTVRVVQVMGGLQKLTRK